MKNYIIKVFHSETALARMDGITIGLLIAGIMIYITKR